ncbi:hypothetical protein WK00_24870 [Burkholderia ubonensis]|nr:hypothetical protein WK00_24870 [Burkholderia ubonensis]KVV02042.1 hypothetical protein WK76_01490 [Burkholderia ubonensis]
MRLMGWSAIWVRTYSRQARGLIPLSLHVPIRPYIAAARSPPLSEPANRKFLRPGLTQRSAFSGKALLISARPSSQYSMSASHWLSE